MKRSDDAREREGVGLPPARAWPEWAEKRRKGNRLIGIALFALVALFVVGFVLRYVAR